MHPTDLFSASLQRHFVRRLLSCIDDRHMAGHFRLSHDELCPSVTNGQSATCLGTWALCTAQLTAADLDQETHQVHGQGSSCTVQGGKASRYLIPHGLNHVCPEASRLEFVKSIRLE